MLRWFCLLLPTAVLACGSKAIELNGENGAIIASSTDPTVLGTVRESDSALPPLGQIAVDDTRVYWLVDSTLYGCDKTQCASSLVTYSTRVDDGVGFGVQGGEIYWFEFGAASLGANGAVSVGPGTSLLNVMASSATGAPAPRVIASNDDWPITGFFDDDAVYYFVDNEIRVLPLPNGGSPKTLATLAAPGALTFRAQGDYLYWVTALRQSTGSIQRTRKDGTSPVETLADSLQINAPTFPAEPPGSLALDASYFYWVENVLTGSIKRCPLAGCSGAPEVLLSPVRSPTGVWIDGANAYFSYEIDTYSYAISRCALDDCAPLATDVEGTDLFAVDDQFFYTETTSQNLAPSDMPPSWVAQIRRFDK
jgi:hypothetical protein